MVETESEIPDWIELKQTDGSQSCSTTFINFDQLSPGDTNFRMTLRPLEGRGYSVYYEARITPTKDNLACGWNSKEICCRFMIEKWETPEVKINLLPRADIKYEENHFLRKLEDWFIIYLTELLSKKVDFEKLFEHELSQGQLDLIIKHDPKHDPEFI